MKIFRLFAVLFLIFILQSCSIQEKVSPNILKTRIEKQYPEFVFDNNGFYKENNYYNFAVFKEETIAFKMYFDENDTVVKIAVLFDNNDETENIIKPVIETFSPNEDCEKTISELKQNGEGFSYSYGKEYTYSLVVNENNVYFEVFNYSLSDYTVPDLTLKQNDRITY